MELGSLQAAWLCRAPGPGLALTLVHILATVSDQQKQVITETTPNFSHLAGVKIILCMTN